VPGLGGPPGLAVEWRSPSGSPSQPRRLDELARGDQAVHACFQVSCTSCATAAIRSKLAARPDSGCSGLPDGPDLGLAAAAPPARPARPTTPGILWSAWSDAQLLESPQPDRYRFHDLVRLFARGTRRAAPRSRAALTRLFDFYVTTAWQTQALLAAGRPARGRPGERPGRRVPDMAAALAWLEAERRT
jgi:hypothetical protein